MTTPTTTTTMKSLPSTPTEIALFQLLYILPWSTVLIIILLLIWKPQELVDHLQQHATTMNIDIRTFIVYSFLAVFGIIILVIGGWKLYLYIKEEMSINHQVIRGIHEKERIALITLFHSLEGNNWYNKIRWCSEEPIDRWHGVKLDPLTHRVNKIILPENRLAGKIPEAIGDLEELIEIDFRRNDIEGTLPPALLKLKKLQGLYLFENRLEGEIPQELSDLPRLSGIYLFNNNFSNSTEAAKVFRQKLPEECHVFI
eukprot:gene8774-9676_t